MRINCPFCGERDSSEFTYLGDAEPTRPDATVTAPPAESDSPKAQALRDAFHEYAYMRENVAGFTRECWYHGAGCRCWLIVERDTVTHEIRSVEAAPGVAKSSPKRARKVRR